MIYNEKGIMTAFMTLLKSEIYKSVYRDAFQAIYDECGDEQKTFFDKCYSANGDFYVFSGNDADKDAAAEIIFNRYSDWWFGYPENNSPVMFSMQIVSYTDNAENGRIKSKIDVHIFVERGHYLEGLWLAKIVKSINVHESDSKHIFGGVYVLSVESFGAMSMSPENYYFVQVNNGSYYPFKITYDVIYGGN